MIIIPDNGSGVYGTIDLVQEPGYETLIIADITGLDPNGLYGWGVHELGDLTDGCAGTGDLFIIEGDILIGDLGTF